MSASSTASGNPWPWLGAALRLAAQEPAGMATHAHAYGALLRAESLLAAARWRRRVLLGAVSLCAGGVGVMLAGTSALLWATTPPAQWQAPWLLVAVPLLPLLASAAAAWAACRVPIERTFEHLRSQWQSDVALLTEPSESSEPSEPSERTVSP